MRGPAGGILAVALAFLCAGCASFWSYDERDYFADLARYAPAASSPAALVGTPNAPATAITPAPAAAPASRLPDPIAIDEAREVDFACADGSNLRVTYSSDRQTAVAQWSDGPRVALSRDDQDGVTRYVSPDASLFRAGRRVAWEGPGEYEVEEGDTLWKIAERTYGVRSRGFEIAALNTDRVADPNLIYPGQRLRLPGGTRRLCARPMTAAAM
ncbi:MAG: LysM peptidoglycan-binding domain-containing protein [Hyphomonadaceae bacterium]|nr:LysM peptidoglycan-binding domain-containing protein [Hyphomonadaceae bacterium]